MDQRDRGRTCASTPGSRSSVATPFLLAALLVLNGCGQEFVPAPPAFPDHAAGQLEIKYPLDETLFPPEIVAPTFLWSDDTAGVEEWSVMLRFEGADEVLRFISVEPSWRPTESDWSEIKRRSEERDADVAIVGIGEDAAVVSAASIRIRTSTDPVSDSIFYREVPLPFISAVQDLSLIHISEPTRLKTRSRMPSSA